MAKATAATPAKVESPFKVQLKVHSQESSTIIRKERLPMITDKTVNAVKWLADKGFQASEVEIIGEKPATWDEVFVPAVVA